MKMLRQAAMANKRRILGNEKAKTERRQLKRQLLQLPDQHSPADLAVLRFGIVPAGGRNQCRKIASRIVGINGPRQTTSVNVRRSRHCELRTVCAHSANQ